ncbi:hypothetical protein [Lacrimispora sp.]|uniref:hypothetical protein n=1 Tax=Lacrimispora sp. TaxID=2719234 RepID=UPI0034600296
MKLDTPLLNINIEDSIHWFPPISAIGKSYFSTFVRENGIKGVVVYMISNEDEFKNLDIIVEALKDNGILILDRTDLYLNNSDLRKLVKYADKRILIDRKVMPAAELLPYLKTAFIDYDGTRMVITDEDSDGRFREAIKQYHA